MTIQSKPRKSLWDASLHSVFTGLAGAVIVSAAITTSLIHHSGVPNAASLPLGLCLTLLWWKPIAHGLDTLFEKQSRTATAGSHHSGCEKLTSNQ